MTDPKDTSPISPTVSVDVTDTNGGVYTISYQRPGPVSQADVEHDLWCLGEALAQREADVAEAVVNSDEYAVTAHGITVHMMGPAAIAAAFGDADDEHVRVMVDDETTGRAVFITMPETGPWAVSVDNQPDDLTADTITVPLVLRYRSDDVPEGVDPAAWAEQQIRDSLCDTNRAEPV